MKKLPKSTGFLYVMTELLPNWFANEPLLRDNPETVTLITARLRAKLSVSLQTGCLKEFKQQISKIGHCNNK